MKSIIINLIFLIISSLALYNPHIALQQTIKYPSIKVTYVIDDYSYIPTNIMYPSSKPESWKQFDELTDNQGNMLVTFGGFLIESGNKKVLMDLGLGTEKVNFPGFGMVSGKGYLDSLKNLGINPEDITDVFYTHLHMDHCGWTSIEKNGKRVLTFPNAEHWVAEEEWNYWTKIDFPTLQKNIINPLKGKIKFIKDGQEIAPNLNAYLAPGHTPGMAILKLKLENKILWFTSDIFHSIMQFTQRDWYSVFDIDAKTAEVTRQKFLPEFLENNAYIANAHFSNYVYGKIIKEKEELKWIPCIKKECSLIKEDHEINKEDL